MTNSPDQLKACREAFEKHLTSNGVAFDRPADASGIVTIYSDYYTNQAWETWQAAWNTRHTQDDGAVAGCLNVRGRLCDPFMACHVIDPHLWDEMNIVKLYAHPPRSVDEADAARYRWAKENRWPTACPTGYFLSDGVIYPSEDQAIDAAMAARGGE